MALLLKLLEMKEKRDVLLIIYLSYFSVLTQLLFSQNILSTIYVIFAFILVTSGLVSLNQSDQVQRSHAFNVALKLFLASLPLMLTAFIVFPRLDPLWTLPKFSKTAKTGLSGQMSPGDFSNLQQSDKLVLRVKFDGKLPTINQLYWRAIVLENFDGRNWSPRIAGQYRRLSKERLNSLSKQEERGEVATYEVTQEATFTNWLFSLDELLTTERGVYFETRVINNLKPITDRVQYTLSSDLDRAGLKTFDLPKDLRTINTKLPKRI